MSDLELRRSLRRGASGAQVRLVQEWLCLQGVDVGVDGAYGAATEAAVRRFQGDHRLKEDGAVGEKTFGKLIEPMTRAIARAQAAEGKLGPLVVAYARQHFGERPREVGGQNSGPWVRLYMRGREGAEWPWCAGFACYVLRQACDTLDLALPIAPSFSCDSLAASAKERGIFVRQADVKSTAVTPGSFFLVRRSSEDWVHVGIVIATSDDTIETIEGNTNDDGAREGYEVCQRIRGYGKKDFIAI